MQKGRGKEECKREGIKKNAICKREGVKKNAICKREGVKKNAKGRGKEECNL